MQFSCLADQTFNKCGHGEMVNGKSQRYASSGLNESAVHIAEQINSVAEVVDKLQSKLAGFSHK